MSKLTAEERTVITEMIAVLRKGWCTGSFAVDEEGREVPVNSPYACAWCTIGALDLVCNRSPTRSTPAILVKLEAAFDACCLAAWNDSHEDADEVISALTELLEKQGDGNE